MAGQDRLLHILRWVIAPIVIAVITGYYETRVRNAKEQTRASYDTLAPGVLELQTQVAKLTGRVEELSKRQVPCPELPAPKPARPPTVAKPSGLAGLLGSGNVGKTELMMTPAANAPAPSPKKVPARFEDMIQQQAK